MFGNVYMVGTCGIVALLVTSDQGHILIDGATQAAAPLIAENIRTLGFHPRDVKVLLSSHEHVDHVGGLAALKQLTGAQMLARAEARASLATGSYDKRDPQVTILAPFPAVKVDRVVTHGETIAVGPLRLTALASPGHAPGGTTWTWQSCESQTCYQFVYADSLNAVSADNYRFTEHPDYVAPLRTSIAMIAGLTKMRHHHQWPPIDNQFLRTIGGRSAVGRRDGLRTVRQSRRTKASDALGQRSSNSKMKGTAWTCASTTRGPFN